MTKLQITKTIEDDGEYIIFTTQDGFLKRCLISEFNNIVDLDQIEKLIGDEESNIIDIKIVNNDDILSFEETLFSDDEILKEVSDIKITKKLEISTEKIEIINEIIIVSKYNDFKIEENRHIL